MNRQKTLVSVILFAVLVGFGLAAPPTKKVNINTATLAALDSLPGIGPAIAGRILEFRSKNGPFRQIEDLMAVRGIGEKKFLKLKERICVSDSGESVPARRRTVRKK